MILPLRGANEFIELTYRVWVRIYLQETGGGTPKHAAATSLSMADGFPVAIRM